MNILRGESRAREIRVFISSTFRDMMKERDLLVKLVFPELRRKCARRFVTFTEVDLRWGITGEQAAEGQVLPLCLAEIERSRPYFIGLLGERYGWVPDEIRPELIEQEPWLREHVQGRASVTELEILHGVLNNPQMKSLAFFYFRDPAYVNDPSLSAEERREMVERNIRAEEERHGEAEATRRTEERKARLAALKQRIRDSKLPLVESYASPEALAEIVRKQFDELIDRLYPAVEVPDPLVQERMAHEAFAKNKLFACIERPAHIQALNTFAAQPEHHGKGLVVTGESGSGKTALLAAWARDWAATHPDEFLFQHYFGATPDSVSPDGFLRRLLGELKANFDIAEDIPDDPEKLRDVLPAWLAQASAGQGRIVLVLDGLNQVQGGEPDRRLRLLPLHCSPQVTVMASALPGSALDALRERGWVEHVLPGSSDAEVEAMAGEYLRIHARTLEPALHRQLVSSPGSKNPLFLRTVLEELRQFGSFEQLPQRIAHYLEADNPRDLFRRVIGRWQEDFDAKDPAGEKWTGGLVCRALTHLWAARQGLSEPEWLDLLGADLEPPTAGSASRNAQPEMRLSPLPRAHWTPLFLALEPHLNRRAGLYGFGHDYLRQAVEAAFLPGRAAQRATHLAIAVYFAYHPGQREMTLRKAEEWPFQLHAAEDWERLETCLTDMHLFLALYNSKTKWELTGYWHPLRRRGRDMGACYAEAHRRWIESPERSRARFISAQVGSFLVENGIHASAEPLLRRAMEEYERELGPGHPSTLTSLNNLAVLLNNKGDYDGAESLYRRVLEARERAPGPEHPAILASLNNLASLLGSKGDFAGAEPLLRRALETGERVLGPEHPHTLTSLHNLAALVENKGDYAGAEQLYRRALGSREKVLGPEHPDTLYSINSLARLLIKKADYHRAEPLCRRVLESREKVLGPEHPDTLISMSDLAGLLYNKGDYAAAGPLLRRALEDCGRVLGPDHPATLARLNDLAGLLYNQGDYAAAEPLLRRVLAAREEALGPDHPSTLESVNDLAGVLARRGDCAAAGPLYRRALETGERVLGPEHPATLASLNDLALLLKGKGDYDGAEPLYRRVAEARERVLGPEHPDTLASVNNLTVLLREKGDLAGAEWLHRRSLEIKERVLGPDHPDTLVTVNNLAVLLESKGDYAGAEPLCRRALEARERALGPEHPDTLASLNNLSELLKSKGDYAGAEPLCRRALEAREKVLGPEHPDTLQSVTTLAELIKDKGNYAGAELLFRRALEAIERVRGPDHPSTLASLNNLAGLLKNKGDYAGAEPLFRRSLESGERVLGPDHPHTLASLNNLAVLLESIGDHASAEPFYRRALEAKERRLGPEHPDTLLSVSNLSVFLESRGDYAGAEPLCRRALESKERRLGPEHPDTLLSVNNLAAILFHKGDYAGAELLFRRVMEARERMQGPLHPDTLLCTNNLAVLLHSIGDYAGAETLYRRALENRERVMGPDHPDTLASVGNLALFLHSRGDYEAAEPLYRRVLEGLSKISAAIRRPHPDLQMFTDHYSLCLAKLGRTRDGHRD